jgi:S-formylglutathione hydrolase FrmB
MRTRTLAVSAMALTLLGSVGAYRYGRTYWLYRGFPAPSHPAAISSGTVTDLHVRSPALGGRTMDVRVYLPPGYRAHPDRRYPVLYLLHGYPGDTGAFLEVGGMGVREDVLVDAGRMAPTILVMPPGSTSLLGHDTEWADGVGKDSRWETYMTRDVVRAVDRRLRTIPSASGRAIGGLSEGGYGALNIALHHPGEFGTIESWSGYEEAFHLPHVFGGSARLLAYDSPMSWLPHVAARLRAGHVFVWFYSGTADRLRHQNARFAAELTALGVDHRFFTAPGRHNWRLWRAEADQALLVASQHLAHDG